VRINTALAASLIALALPPTADARAGDPDPTFGLGGEAVVTLGGYEPYVIGLATAPDGSIVVAAEEHFPLGRELDVLMRFTKDGRLDRRFGTRGIASLPNLRVAAAPVVEPGGILVAGSVATADGSGFAVARFARDGAPDASFGDQGVTVVPFPAQTSYATGVARDADGRIVAGGTASEEFAVARLTPGGSIDTTFGDGGRTMSNVSPGSSHGRGLALDSAGRAVITGDGMDFDSEGHSRQFPLLVRYTTAGRLDDGFGGGGIVRVPVERASGSQVLAQPDGGLVVTATGVAALPILRYRDDGTLDPAFGAGGDATTRRLGVNLGLALARQPDGKLLVSANAGAVTLVGGWALARLNPDGSPDRSFGDHGIFTTVRGADYGFPAGLGLQPHGGIVVGGSSMACGSPVISLIRIKGHAGGQALGAPAIRGCDPVASKNGRTVSVVVDCPILAAACKGTVALRHGSLRIGAGRFDLHANIRYTVVKVRAQRGARQLLAKRRTLPATARYRVKGKRGPARTIVRHVTIKASAG
jgi:uncharacterized delta-60 repeat protein